MDPQDAATVDSQDEENEPTITHLLDPENLNNNFEQYGFVPDDFSETSSIPVRISDDDYCIALGMRPNIAASLHRCHIFPKKPLAGLNPQAVPNPPGDLYTQALKNLKQLQYYIIGGYYKSALHLEGEVPPFTGSVGLSKKASERLRELRNGEIISCGQVSDLLSACSREMLKQEQNILLLKTDVHDEFDNYPEPWLLFSVPREEAAPMLARALGPLQRAISENKVTSWHPTLDMYSNDTAAPPPGQQIAYPFPSRQAHKDAVAEDSIRPTRNCFNIFTHASSRHLYERRGANGMFDFQPPARTQYVGLTRPSRTGHAINVALNFAMRSNPAFEAVDGRLEETHFLYHDGRNNGLLLQRLAVIHLYPEKARALARDLHRYLYTPEALVPRPKAASEELRIDSESSTVEVEQLVDVACLAELQAYDRLKGAETALRESSLDMEDPSRAELLDAVASAERLFQQAHGQCCKKRCDENGALPFMSLPDHLLYTIALHMSGGTTASSDEQPADINAVSPSATADAEVDSETFDQTLVNDESVDGISDKVAAWRMTMPPSSASLLPMPEAS